MITGLDFVRMFANEPDDHIWFIAGACVGLAGARASMRDRPDVERACIDFLQKMHELVGTPPPPRQKGVQ